LTEIIAEKPGPRWAPQIVVLLDNEACVLDVNRSLAGTRFSSISASTRGRIHGQLHPACDGKCRFNRLWYKAWDSLKNRATIEWELDDPELNCLLRLNLSNAPAPKNIGHERRQRHKLLTITDITKYRREYETLVEQQQALIRLLMAQSLRSESPNEPPFDDTGDTGNRLMSGYLKTERSLSRQLIRAQEKERKRVAAELHDGLAQTIGVVKYRLESNVAGIAERYPELDLGVFDATIDEIKGLLEEVRRISSNLSPSMLEDFGIQVALEWLCKEFQAQNHSVNVRCVINVDEADTPDLVKIAIYRLVQEALNNIGKHASAAQVDVSLESVDGGVRLFVSDDGSGCDRRHAQPRFDGTAGLGLRSMSERVDSTGGTFTTKSEDGDGFEVRATWAKDELDSSR